MLAIPFGDVCYHFGVLVPLNFLYDFLFQKFYVTSFWTLVFEGLNH